MSKATLVDAAEVGADASEAAAAESDALESSLTEAVALKSAVAMLMQQKAVAVVAAAAIMFAVKLPAKLLLWKVLQPTLPWCKLLWQ